jgi:hypothetical protein
MQTIHFSTSEIMILLSLLLATVVTDLLQNLGGDFVLKDLGDLHFFSWY